MILILSGTHFVRRDIDGDVVLDTRVVEPPFEMPKTLWSEPIAPHSLQNAGVGELRFISVELKYPAGPTSAAEV